MSRRRLRQKEVSIMKYIPFILECLGSVALALLLLFVVRSIPRAKKFQLSNEALGLHFACIGTIYAVLLAFMLTSVWGKYEEVETTCEREAGYLMGVYRLAQGLSEPYSHDIQKAARK